MTGPRRRSFLKRSSTAALVALTGVAGCIGDDNDGATTGTYTVAATIPKTGPFSALGPDIKQGYELGVKRMNANGGVNGQSVELIVRDDESDPKTLRTQLTAILSNNDVDMIWGSFAGILLIATSAVAEHENIPMLGIAFSDDELHKERGFEWTFAPFPKSSDHAKGTKNVLQLIPNEKRPTRVGLWVPNTRWSIEMADYWEKTLSSSGFEVVFRQKHQLHAKDFSSLIAQSQAAGVEILLGSPAPDGGITAMKQLNTSSFTPSFIEFIRAADTSGWHSALGTAGRHVVMAPGWVPGLTGNGNERLARTYADTYEDVGPYLPVMTGASYNLTQVAEQALEAADSTEKAVVRKALRTTTFKTVAGEFSFDDVGRPEGLTSPVGQWIDGHHHLIYPKTDHEAARELVYPIER